MVKERELLAVIDKRMFWTLLAVVGVVAGLLTAMTGPLFGLVFMVSLLPAALFVLVVAGAAGAILGGRIVPDAAKAEAAPSAG